MARSLISARAASRDAVHGSAPAHGHHRNIQGGAARAAVFGISDGLVTNVSLILGVAGAEARGAFVRLAGLAGLVAGAISMATGEYVSMKAQRELLERELALERRALHRNPEGERRELAQIYESRGVDHEVAMELAGRMMRDPETALEVHAREELGVDPNSLGSPLGAAFSSFVTFSLGALIPLVPWFFGQGTAAILISIIVSAVTAVAVGSALAVFTGRSIVLTATRQLVLSAIAASVTFGIGKAVGVGVA